ncbi:hypothetical protein [Enterovibrio calviensis]|uniref:hypothetical protein n=1 Tax=Enterovibrio calviensis TaxID=91359 RepID=UPI0037355045
MHLLDVPAFDQREVPDWLDDIVSGVLATFYEKKTNKNNQAYVNKAKLFRFMSYHNEPTFTTEDIALIINVAPRTARQYAEVLRSIAPFVERAKASGQLYKVAYPFHKLPSHDVRQKLAAVA